MLKSVFEYWIPCNNEGIVAQIVEENFSRSAEWVVHEEDFLHTHLQYLNLIQKHYQLRYENTPL